MSPLSSQAGQADLALGGFLPCAMLAQVPAELAQGGYMPCSHWNAPTPLWFPKLPVFFLLNTHLKSIYSIPPKVAGGVLQLYSLKKSLLSSLVRVPVVAGTFP